MWTFCHYVNNLSIFKSKSFNGLLLPLTLCITLSTIHDIQALERNGKSFTCPWLAKLIP